MTILKVQLTQFTLFVLMTVLPITVYASTDFILLDENGQPIVEEVEGLNGRDTLISGLHDQLIYFLKNFTHQREFKNIPEAERKFLSQIQIIVEKNRSPLNFLSDAHYFNNLKGGENRLMGTSTNLGDPININIDLLAHLDLDITTLFSLLVHEYGHKSSEPDWAVRDSAARKFSEYLKRFSRKEIFSQDLTVDIISLPAGKVDIFLKDVGPNGVQPTFLIIVNQQGHFSNLTSSIANEFARQASTYKNIFTEIRRLVIHAIAPLADILSTFMSQAFGPLAKAFGATGFDDVESEISKNIADLNSGIGEVRILDIHSIKSIEMGERTEFVFGAKYTVGHELREKMPIEVNGWPFEKEQKMYLKLKTSTKKSKSNSLSLAQLSISRSLEPSTTMTAEIVEKDSGSTGVSLKVILSNLQDFEYAVLNVQAGNDSFYLYPSAGAVNTQDQIDQARKQIQEQLGQMGGFFGGLIDQALQQLGQQVQASGAVKEIFKNMKSAELYFDIPEWMLESEGLIYADSLIVNRDQEVSLKETMKLSKGSNLYKPKPQGAKIVKNSLGFWGMKSSKVMFKNEFNYHESIYNFFNIPQLNNPVFSLDARETKMEFILDQPIDIQGVKLSLSHQAFILDAEPGRLGNLNIEGKQVPFAEGGNLKEIKDFPQIYSVPPQHIKTTLLANGQMKVEVLFKFGMKFAREILPEETNFGHAIPILIFQSLEVFSTDGAVIYQNIGEPLEKEVLSNNSEFKDCAEQLKGHFKK